MLLIFFLFYISLCSLVFNLSNHWLLVFWKNLDGKNLNTNYLERQKKEHLLTRDKRAKKSANVIVQTKYRNQAMTNFKTIVSSIHFK